MGQSVGGIIIWFENNKQNFETFITEEAFTNFGKELLARIPQPHILLMLTNDDGSMDICKAPEWSQN